MRRVYSTALIVLFVGVLVAGGGMGFNSIVAFRIGLGLVALGVVGVLVYAFRPKTSRGRGPDGPDAGPRSS